MRLINKKIITVIFFLWILAGTIILHPRDNNSGSESAVCSVDSLQIIIQDKIAFYQSEQNKNTEAIEALQKELEQRRALNERLNGAAAAAQEILYKIREYSDDSSK